MKTALYSVSKFRYIFLGFVFGQLMYLLFTAEEVTPQNIRRTCVQMIVFFIIFVVLDLVHIRIYASELVRKTLLVIARTKPDTEQLEL